jgi:hypothetical protein
MALRRIGVAGILGMLAGCGGNAPAELSDPRSTALMMMSAPQFTANRNLSIELANDCSAFEWNGRLDVAINAGRAQLDPPDASRAVLRDATRVEDDILRRAMRVNYGSAGACDILRGEAARKTPLSILVQEL